MKKLLACICLCMLLAHTDVVRAQSFDEVATESVHEHSASSVDSASTGTINGLLTESRNSRNDSPRTNYARQMIHQRASYKAYQRHTRIQARRWRGDSAWRYRHNPYGTFYLPSAWWLYHNGYYAIPATW